MRIFFIFIFTLFCFGNAFAQKEKDSLFSVWNNLKLKDSTRIEAMRDLIETHYLYKKTDSALVLGEQILDLAQKKNNIKLEAEANTLIGKVYFELQEFDRGEEIYTKGMELALTSKDSFLYAEKVFDLGYLYKQYYDYTSAFKTLKLSQELYRKLEDPLNEGWSIVHQGFIYRDLGDYKESEKYHQRHLKLSQEHDIKQSISAAYGNLGEVYHKMGDLPKSIQYWAKAIGLSKELGLHEYANVGTGKLVEIYIAEQQYSEAITYLNEYKTVASKVEIPTYERSFSMNIHLWQCQIDYGLKNYNKALNECENCLKVYKSNGWKPESDILKSLYEVNKKLNRHAMALDYFEKYQLAVDDENVIKSREEIQSIVFNNQILADSIAQAQEKELLNLTYEEGLRKKNQEKNLFLIIGLLVLLSAIAYFIVFKRVAASERKRLKEINQLKSNLFTNITHEFRTPLTVIKGMTDTIKSNLKRKNLNTIDSSLGMIERNSNDLLHLVNEMLDLTKLESGNMELQLVQADVIPFLKYVGESFESYAEENQIKLTIYSELDSLVMDFDTNKLTSIISNLLSNAIKFTPEFGKIIVHINKVTQNETSHLFIKVKDSGIGIAQKELPNIFSRFYQADASTIRQREGTGIGLALTKELVDLMDGTIKVKSSLDDGSEFSITIPISNKADKSEALQIGQSMYLSSTRIKPVKPQQKINEDTSLPLVLIIEDNLDVAHYLKTCLIGKYDTIHAENGIVGIELAFEKIPDIIISDVMMPGKDGLEVCEALKSDERTDHIPIILLTAKVTINDRLIGLSHGADAYLGKPFNKEELFTRLYQLLLLRRTIIAKYESRTFSQLLEKPKESESRENKYLNKIVTIIQSEMNNHAFGSKELAEKLYLSESQIYRKLKAITGKSTAVFIRSIRLHKSKELIQTTNNTISQIAYDVGFNDPSWFSRAFKEEFGLSPSDLK